MIDFTFLQWLFVSFTGIGIIVLIITRYRIWLIKHKDNSVPLKPNGTSMTVDFRNDFFSWYMANEHGKSLHGIFPSDLTNYPYNMTFGIYQAFMKYKNLYAEIVNEVIGEHELVHGFKVSEFDENGKYKTCYESFVGYGSTYTGAWKDIEEAMSNCIEKCVELYEERKG